MVKQKLHVNVLGGGIVGGCIVMMVLTLFISAIGAMILDNTLLKWLQKPLQKSRDRNKNTRYEFVHRFIK
ncbi:hypothetical protein [Roseburia intestinalis]